jgi:hypothetical protein
MRLFERCVKVSIALSLCCAFASGQARAAAVSFTPQPNLNGGAIVGRIPISKFGKLELPRGRAYFKANIVEVTAIPEWQFDRELVLSGPILKCWSAIDGKNATINGIAYFQDGEWLKYIDENSPDKVLTVNEVFTGQISAMKNGLLEVTSEAGTVHQIPIASVEQIISPRAYTFSVPVTAFLSVPQGEPISGDAATVALKPTNKVIALSAVKRDPLMKGDGDIGVSKLTALWAGLSSVEILQFLPLAILEGPIRRQLVQQYHSRINQGQQYSNVVTDFGTNYQNSNRAPGANPFVSLPVFGVPNLTGTGQFGLPGATSSAFGLVTP